MMLCCVYLYFIDIFSGGKRWKAHFLRETILLEFCRHVAKDSFVFQLKDVQSLLRALFAKFHHYVNSFLLRLITHPFVSKQSQMFNILFACGLTDYSCLLLIGFYLVGEGQVQYNKSCPFQQTMASAFSVIHKTPMQWAHCVKTILPKHTRPILDNKS